jgi:branched-chain amino acid aminotransferase
MLTRGAGPLGLDPDLATHPLRVIFVEPLRAPARDAYARGIRAALVATRRVSDATDAAGAKLANYLPNLLAFRQAKALGASEALIVDMRGRVVEGASSNVFVVKGGLLVTPPESTGLLPGITRAHVLDVARLLGVRAEERDLHPDDLYLADEAFVTSSIREIMPLIQVDARAVGSGLPGEVTRALHRAFRLRVGAPGPMPWE